jgi:hypothetical protein
MKRKNLHIEKLREELHYHRTMARVALRSARAGFAKCREIGAQMRELQRQNDR